MESRILVCVCGADGEKPRYNRVFTGTISSLPARNQNCENNDLRPRQGRSPAILFTYATLNGVTCSKPGLEAPHLCIILREVVIYECALAIGLERRFSSIATRFIAYSTS